MVPQVSMGLFPFSRGGTEVLDPGLEISFEPSEFFFSNIERGERDILIARLSDHLHEAICAGP